MGVVWILVVGAMLCVAAPAFGAPIAVSVDSREVELEEADRGWTTEVGITNLTDREFDLEIPFLSEPEGCLPRIQDGKLRVGEHRTVEVKIPPKCDAGENGLVFFLSSATPQGAPFPLEMIAAPKDEDDPSWSILWVFAGASILLILIGLAYSLLGLKQKLGTPLQYLGATWNFKESWVTNITVAGGLLTGIFGSSDVIKAVLGEETDSAVALATVGAAIALALLAAGPLILESLKATVTDPTKTNDIGKQHPSLVGLMLASAITLAAAFGELWVVATSASRLELGGSEDWLPWLLAILGSLLLLVYGIRNFKRTVEVGMTDPGTAADSDTITAARMIVDQLRAGEGDRAAVAAPAEYAVGVPARPAAMP